MESRIEWDIPPKDVLSKVEIELTAEKVYYQELQNLIRNLAEFNMESPSGWVNIDISIHLTNNPPEYRRRFADFLRELFDCNDYYREIVPEQFVIFTGHPKDHRKEVLEDMEQRIQTWMSGLQIALILIDKIQNINQSKPPKNIKDIYNVDSLTYFSVRDFLAVSRDYDCDLTKRLSINKGSLKMKVTKKIGYFMTYWPNGNKSHERRFNQDGQKEGEETYWKEDGTLEFKCMDGVIVEEEN